MIAALTRRIQDAYMTELQLPLWPACPAIEPGPGEGPIETVTAVVTGKPALMSRGVSVDVVAYTRRSGRGADLMISVSLQVPPDPARAHVFWHEADAWANAIAEGSSLVPEPDGLFEHSNGRTYHYSLRVEGSAEEPDAGNNGERRRIPVPSYGPFTTRQPLFGRQPGRSVRLP
ncbi:hypothetical protein [Paenarthrobacter sp. NPDC058040]|uniref:hypothetical protein n=1 Tax=unclassified Paenarthrobacter TaxID=2634190 RepID=UPI0036D75F29